MALETFQYLNSLVPDNPAPTDGLVNGDDHIRGIKYALKQTFPNVTGPVNSTNAQIDAIAGALVGGTLRVQGACPAGAIMDFGMAFAPAGWLACDGSILSRTTYSDLFAAIGTTWGAGDGSTTFQIPNFSSRFRRMSGTFGGAVGTLQNPAISSHSHSVSGSTGTESNSHQHGFSGVTGNDSPDHSHSTTLYQNNGVGGGSTFVAYTAYATGGTGVSVGTSGASTRHQHAFSGSTGAQDVPHTHTFSGSTSATGDTETRPYSATVLTCIKV